MIIKKIILPDCINEPESIIDTEISNDIASLGWVYHLGEVMCYGRLMGKEIIIIQKENNDDKEEDKKFLECAKNEIISDFQKIRAWSFNNQFEIGVTKNLTGFSYKDYIKDIVVWKGKGWGKDKFFKLFLEGNFEKVPDEIMILINKDELDGSKMQDLYKNKEYQKIIEHNIADLLKTYYVKKYALAIKSKYEKSLNPNYAGS